MKLLRITAAAEILQITSWTLRSWADRGILPADFISPFGQRLFDEDRIRAIARDQLLDKRNLAKAKRTAGQADGAAA